MKVTLTFIRLVFAVIAALLLVGYVINASAEGVASSNIVIGVSVVASVVVGLIVADRLLARSTVRAFNVAALGLVFGYIMGHIMLMVLNSVFYSGVFNAPSQHALQWINMSVVLGSLYLGMVLTVRGAEELSVSIPFVRFKAMVDKKKDILIDASVLHDTRLLDLANSGLLDFHLVLPRFVLAELQAQLEQGDESAKLRTRRALDVVKKLEAVPALGLRFTDTDFPEAKDSMAKLIRLARLMDANVLTADMNRVQQSEVEGIRVINIHTLANLLKPITQTGEYLNIKIQRYGKEARQGVGYLEDGTMVVVNGAADFIGEVIKARVLSVKHTTSGRMIFCNAADEDGMLGMSLESLGSQDELALASTKKYFAH